MKNFMIGQYGGFDYTKFTRDYRAQFFGIEACLFENEEDTVNLIKEAKLADFQIGIHYPFRAGVSDLRDALFLAQDNATREHAFKLIQNELDYLTSVQPNYILFHYPKPVILDDRANWDKWRFAGSCDYVFENNYSFKELVEKSEYLFQWLSLKSEEYHFTPVLELDALNKYVYKTTFLEALLVKYPRIKLCLDTGRLYLQSRTDPHFNAYAVIKKFAKYAEVIHLANVQVTETVSHNHYPVLPELDPANGWAPIKEYLQIIKSENPAVKIYFEHRSDLISQEDLERCYSWVDEIMNKS